MKIFRLIKVFLALRKSGIFYYFIDSFNPLLKPFSKPKNIPFKFREALESLGPMFIKLGQLLSTRTDIFDYEVSKELNKLTDNCAPVDFSYISDLIKKELGVKSESILKNIEVTPLASASLAQVHRLKVNEEEMVIKVQRPYLFQQIKGDLAAIKDGVKMLRFFYKGYPRVNLMDLASDYENVLLNELDFRIEAANAKKTFEIFKNSHLLYVPKIFDEYTTKKILVMEYVDGIPVTDVNQMKEKGLDLKKLSENGVQIFLKQVFDDNFFHADMHPGNIFASKETPGSPSYYAVDYAICGSITESNQILLAQMISCLTERDFYSLAQLFIFAEWVDEKTKTEDLESVLRANCESVLDSPLSEILFGELLLNLFDSMRKFDLYLDNDLMLLIKTLIHIEGMGRQIYPELDFWIVATPFLKNWIKEKYSIKGLVRYLVSKKHILTYMIVKKIEESRQQFSDKEGEL